MKKLKNPDINIEVKFNCVEWEHSQSLQTTLKYSSILCVVFLINFPKLSNLKFKLFYHVTFLFSILRQDPWISALNFRSELMCRVSWVRIPWGYDNTPPLSHGEFMAEIALWGKCI